MSPITYSRFLEFLTQELSLPTRSISMAERSVEENSGLLPMILWKYGLVTLQELDKIYEWLESA
ncbi:DUF2949 domain-containing protein [Gloeocapsa sp. PCC 73106]|uniref:DUF2949 domain-containing protein n=1 Tax=Gloeocapsa sp. PCC 73106 TaxID=102232 RepID=UPI000554D908|nr:DUF2949 domain-containing protein [Gloeocapsa sp. PCC 73106]